MSKICTKCKQEYPATKEYFHRNKNKKDGFESICKVCKNKYYEENKIHILETTRQYREENKEHCQEIRKKYHQENKDLIARQMKEYYEENKEQLLEYREEYYKENKEYILEQVKLYREENKGRIVEKRKKYREKNKERITETCRRYWNNNKEYLSRKNREYRIENKEQEQERHRRHYIENPHMYRQSVQRRRSKVKKLPYTLTIEEWNDIKSHFNNSCAYCGMTEEKHMEKFNERLHQEHFVALSNGGEYTRNNIIPSCKSCNSSKCDKDFFEWYFKQEYYSKNRERKILKFLNYKNDDIQQISIL